MVVVSDKFIMCKYVYDVKGRYEIKVIREIEKVKKIFKIIFVIDEEYRGEVFVYERFNKFMMFLSVLMDLKDWVYKNGLLIELVVILVN